MKTHLIVLAAILCGAFELPKPAYLISNAETVTDTTMVKQYGGLVGKTIRDYGGTVLVGAVPP